MIENKKQPQEPDYKLLAEKFLALFDKLRDDQTGLFTTDKDLANQVDLPAEVNPYFSVIKNDCKKFIETENPDVLSNTTTERLKRLVRKLEGLDTLRQKLRDPSSLHKRFDQLEEQVKTNTNKVLNQLKDQATANTNQLLSKLKEQPDAKQFKYLGGTLIGLLLVILGLLFFRPANVTSGNRSSTPPSGPVKANPPMDDQPTGLFDRLVQTHDSPIDSTCLALENEFQRLLQNRFSSLSALHERNSDIVIQDKQALMSLMRRAKGQACERDLEKTFNHRIHLALLYIYYKLEDINQLNGVSGNYLASTPSDAEEIRNISKTLYWNLERKNTSPSVDKHIEAIDSMLHYLPATLVKDISDMEGVPNIKNILQQERRELEQAKARQSTLIEVYDSPHNNVSNKRAREIADKLKEAGYNASYEGRPSSGMFETTWLYYSAALSKSHRLHIKSICERYTDRLYIEPYTTADVSFIRERKFSDFENRKVHGILIL